MSTSWERLIDAVFNQHIEIGEVAGVPPKAAVAPMLLAAARLEGGWGDAPGIGDKQFAPKSGPSYGWYQFNVGYDADRSWQPEGRHMLDSLGWTIEEFSNEEKIVAYWGPKLCQAWLKLPDNKDRERQAIFKDRTSSDDL